MHCVLHVQHEEPLLQNGPVHLVAPDGQSLFETKLREMVSAGHLKHAARALVSADLEARAVCQTQPLGEVIEHDRATERSRQRRDEQPVVASRRHTRDRAGGEAAEAVRHEPLVTEQRMGVVARVLFRESQPANQLAHSSSQSRIASSRVSFSSLGPSPPRAKPVNASARAARMATAAWPGMRQLIFVSRGGVPVPP